MFAYMRRGPNFYKEVAALAAPIILQDMITSTLSMADTFMVALPGSEPLATTGRWWSWPPNMAGWRGCPMYSTPFQ